MPAATVLFRTLALFVASLSCVAGIAWAGSEEDGNAGLDAIKSGRFGEAVTLFSRAINSGKLSSGDLAFAYSSRGEAYVGEHRNVLAAVDFKHALSLQPDDADAKAGLARAQGGRSQSASHAPLSRGAPGASAVTLARQGMNALNGGNASEAVRLFSAALNARGLSEEETELALLSRGKAYDQIGNPRDAALDSDRALHMKADDQEAQAELGTALTHIRATVATPGIDRKTCDLNFATQGNLREGKTYTSFATYPTVSKLDALAGLYTAIVAYTPVPGGSWSITAIDLQAGRIAAAVNNLGNQAITLDAGVLPSGGGSMVRITEVVPGLSITVDLRGGLCRTLADVPKG